MAHYKSDNSPLEPPLGSASHFAPDVARQLVARYISSRSTALADEALDAALRACTPLVNSIVIFYADEFDREDVVQEVLLHLITALPTYDADKGELKPFLSAIIRRKAISLWRMRHHREPETPLSLNEEIVADSQFVEDEPEAILPQAALLAHWMRMRFPSVKRSLADRLADEIIVSLADGLSSKATIKELRRVAGRELSCNRVITVHSAALVFLRALGWSSKYANTPSDDAIEFTLIPELYMLLGGDAASQLYALFRGTTVHWRSR